MSLRLIFMGTPDFAVPTLKAVADEHEVVAVYTRAPKAAGRGMAERKSPVHVEAEKRGIPVLYPSSLKSEDAIEVFRAHKADVAVVVAYGLLLPKEILSAPKFGCLNLHASLLPRWRGAAPIQRAIMAGDERTGVEVMRMEEGLDTGPVLAQVQTGIESEDTSSTLHDRLARLGADLLLDTLDKISRGEARETRQSEQGVTYAQKITPAETRIDWARPAREVDCHIRGLAAQPGAWFELGGTRVKALLSRVENGAGAPGTVLDDALLIACGDGAVRLLIVQKEGRGPLPVADFLRGAAVAAGTKLG